MKRLFFFLCLAVCSITVFAKDEVKVINPQVNMTDNPEGVACDKIHFSWQLSSSLYDVKQISYQIEVARSYEDLTAGVSRYWLSPIINNNKSLWIPYGGKALESGKDYYWRVNVWTNKGMFTSAISKWSTALKDNEWKASWIGLKDSTGFSIDSRRRTRLPARYLRKDFRTNANIKRAMLYIAGLGSSETFINGKPITDDVFGSLPTYYPASVSYNTYNVTALLKNNTLNTMGVILGNGRFQSMREPGMRGFGFPRLIAQLEIEYQDGSKEDVLSDPTWKITDKGPIYANNEFDGEEYDARLDLGKWTEPGYNVKSWRYVDMMPAPGGKMTPQLSPCLKVNEEITPMAIKATEKNTYILDMGQNMVGWLKVTLKGKKNIPVTLHFSETLKNEGTELYTDNLRSAKTTDIYIPKQNGTFTWEPTFTYHGFRYVEISGIDDLPDLDSFTGKVIYDKMKTTASFECSNEILTQLFSNAYWGIRGNYRGMPTDCPQRDERLGWLGDRATGSYGESFVFNNDPLYHKWLYDIEESMQDGMICDVSPRYWGVYNQDVTWPATYFYASDVLYQQFGDVRPIKEHYQSMKAWIKYTTDNHMKDYIISHDVYGDWCMPPESPKLIHSKDSTRITNGDLLGTSVFFNILKLMKKFAIINHATADSQYFADLASKIKDAYNKRFFDRNTGRYDNNTVTANILSLYFGMVPPGYEQKVFENVVSKTEKDFDSHVSTGVVGIQQLMRGLTRFGNPDLAYKIATNITYPSWGYMIRRDATTIWELWNGDTADPGMNSGNHVMLLGDLLVWLYEDIAGIKNDSTDIGFKKIIMKPSFPKDLKEVNASFDSPYGMIKSAWKRNGNNLKWRITIPANTSATIEVPIEFNIDITSPDMTYKIWKRRQNNVLELASGEYILQSKGYKEQNE
jgi:alpha-L-rhamnosidase